MMGDTLDLLWGGGRMNIVMAVRGAKEIARSFSRMSRDLRGEEMIGAMRKATMLVTRDAKRFAPVDTGLLRNSITPEVRTKGLLTRRIVGVVGSSVKYAPFQELGARPYWPPLSAMAPWARRHGMTAFQAAAAVAAHGTKAQKFLQRGFEDNVDRIVDLIGRTVGTIISRR